MKQISLGRHRLKVSPIVMGVAGIIKSDGFDLSGKTDEKELVSTIHRSLELGGNFLDITGSKDLSENEKLIGRAIEGKRAQYILAACYRYGVDDTGIAGQQKTTRQAHIKNAVERSLKNLGTDYLDLYYLQQPDTDERIEEGMSALVKLVREGKIGYIGLTDPSSETIRRAQKIHPVAAVQLEYSLFNRSQEQTDIWSIIENLGIGLIARSALGGGFLSGNRRIQSMDGFPLIPDERYEQKMGLLSEIKKMAEEKNIAPAQLAVAWCIAKGSLPVVRTTKIKHLEQNIAATDITLSSYDLNRLERKSVLSPT